MPLPALPLIGAGLGALGGLFGSKSTQTTKPILDPASALENSATAGIGTDYNIFRTMVDKGAGAGDVASATGAQRSLADMLKAYSAEGGTNPSDFDISNSNQLAQRLFGAQRLGLQHSFEDQRIQANNQAALMGRAGNDPILAAKLAREQTRQAGMLDAQQGAWATDYAMQQPMQRLNFAGQHANILGGLATQAMANRQALMSMGQSIQNNERNFRLQTAERETSQSSGGGIGGMISGAIGGAGAGMSAMNSFQGMNNQTNMANAFSKAMSRGPAPISNYGYGNGMPAGPLGPMGGYYSGQMAFGSPTAGPTADGSHYGGAGPTADGRFYGGLNTPPQLGDGTYPGYAKGQYF